MSDRIQELINQTPLRYNTHQSVAERREEIVKFAESIVRECTDVIQAEKDTGLYTAQQMTGMTVSKAVIKDHFGIN